MTGWISLPLRGLARTQLSSSVDVDGLAANLRSSALCIVTAPLHYTLKALISMTKVLKPGYIV